MKLKKDSEIVWRRDFKGENEKKKKKGKNIKYISRSFPSAEEG